MYPFTIYNIKYYIEIFQNDRDEIRTRDPRLKRALLLPTELPDRSYIIYYNKYSNLNQAFL